MHWNNPHEIAHVLLTVLWAAWLAFTSVLPALRDLTDLHPAPQSVIWPDQKVWRPEHWLLCDLLQNQSSSSSLCYINLSHCAPLLERWADQLRSQSSHLLAFWESLSCRAPLKWLFSRLSHGWSQVVGEALQPITASNQVHSFHIIW